MSGKGTSEHNYWLMKSEPSEYSINDLKRDKKGRWDGVRNYQVRNMMRDQMRQGDRALFYHSSTKHIGVVGEMTIIKTAYPDPTQFDASSDHYDPKSQPENPRWLCVDVAFKRTFSNLVTLEAMRGEKVLSDMPIVKKGNRLSIIPLRQKEYEKIVAMGEQ